MQDASLAVQLAPGNDHDAQPTSTTQSTEQVHVPTSTTPLTRRAHHAHSDRDLQFRRIKGRLSTEGSVNPHQ